MSVTENSWSLSTKWAIFLYVCVTFMIFRFFCCFGWRSLFLCAMGIAAFSLTFAFHLLESIWFVGKMDMSKLRWMTTSMCKWKRSQRRPQIDVELSVKCAASLHAYVSWNRRRGKIVWKQKNYCQVKNDCQDQTVRWWVFQYISFILKGKKQENIRLLLFSLHTAWLTNECMHTHTHTRVISYAFSHCDSNERILCSLFFI